MKIEMLTFQNVGPGLTASEAELRPHDADIDTFLIDHLNALLSAANGGKVATAGFGDEAAETLFRDARDSSEAGFLKAATAMFQQLNETMDKRTPQDLLVIFRTDAPERYLAVLKLQVASEYAATLQQVGEGRVDMRAIKDVLDAPGQIQKGLLYEDPRDTSAVVAKERRSSNSTAAYFLRAYNIVPNLLPAEANVALIRVVSDVSKEIDPTLTNKVITAMPELSDGTVSEVMDQLEQAVPEVAPVRDQIEDRLVSHTRPIESMVPAVGAKKHISIGAIKITGPAQDIAQSVAWDRDADRDGWVTTIHSDTEPRESYRSSR
jgi:hypothetical protein